MLKAYGAPRQFEAALTGLRAAAAGPLRTGAFAGALPELRLTAQRAVAGRRPGSAARWRAAAGALVAELQGARIAGLAAAPPERHLAAAARKAELAATRAAGRCARASRRCSSGSAASCPPGSRRCPRTATSTSTSCCVGDDIAVVDFDQMCLAAPALDIATYAADVVRGREGDLAAVGEVLDAAARRLRRAAGRRSSGTWPSRSSARVAHPFQRQLPGWPERVDGDAARGGDGSCLARASWSPAAPASSART